MYKYTLIFFVFLLSSPLLAQNKYQIKGSVLDKKSKEPVPFAQVALYKLGEDTPYTGVVTQENGDFILQAEKGRYELEVVFVGYEEIRKEVRVRNKSKDLGNISLSTGTQTLDEVVVESEELRQPITADLEGLTISPDQTISNVGGSLLDVLRNTPSVDVDQEGNVTIRGSNGTNVLIDGRNSALASDLEQIPASAIDQVKIVNNPNAKYDAEGEGGVINIQLKRGKDLGTNGKAEVTLGTRYRLNSNLNINHKTDRFNIYGGYSYRSWPRVGNSQTTRLTFDNEERLEQFGDRSSNDREHTVNLGGDYFLGKNKFSYEGAFNTETESDFENNFAQIFNTSNEDIILQYNRQNEETEENYALDNAFIYERLFDDERREFRALISNSYRDQLENQHIDVYSGTINPVGENPTGQERSTTDEFRTTTVVQADYVQPVGEGKLEAGYKSTFRSFDNDYVYEVLNPNEGWIDQGEVSNRFLYEDQIHALYAIYSTSLNNLDISVGSRLEQTFVDTKLYNTNEENEQQYLNLFPSLQALYNLNDENSIKFTYSRRIDRPGGWRLNPFPDIADSLNVRIGNPNLQPEFIHSMELGHMINLNRTDVTSNLFYRHVDGQVDYIVRIEDGISYRQPTNLNTSKTYGFELITTSQITDWWNVNASYSIFQVSVDGTNLDNTFTNDGVSWNAKLTTDVNLPYKIDFQLTGNYTAPEIEAQGRDLARYYVDMSLQRSFLEDKANLSVSFRDVFDTRRFQGESYGEGFSQTFEYKRESQIVLVTLGYNF
ncbi:TonB-dependent receptor domain-containing protein [Catalinimonas niigatensis]|uniref:TonB-dependent receptor domain-containing protein n=1 Tax=Catalinimonas niigatensis TaxID=1397264 RepID=UPI0026653CC9|nr:TonB-dependent receptor [Catalinimonas niigatensis]WPP51500.1 TonB-dependent receptor [Catalinimonas niigatensis]